MIKTILRITLVSMSLIACATAVARPVSYAGGWTLIETSNRASSAGLLHYTLNYNLSVGARYEWQRGSDTRVTAIQPTFLAKRWFGRDYQANLYFSGGIGTAERDVGGIENSETAKFVGVMADWETRSLFVSYEGRRMHLGQLGNQTMHAARVGWAPYEGDTGALHTWLMLEVDHREHMDERTSVTPLLRFFKGPALLEVGYNLSDPSPLFNFTYRF